MSIGDALRDMPDEYREYVKERDMEISTELFLLNHGKEPETQMESENFTLNHDRPVEPVAKAVASIVFKHDGGEWLHMARNIEITKIMPPFGIVPDWNVVGLLSIRWFEFRFTGGDLDLLFLNVGDKGRLSISSDFIGDGSGFTGDAEVISILGGEGSPAISTASKPCVVFRMKCDAAPEYEPDRLYDWLSLPSKLRHRGASICPDCDSQAESRSMPDGIEQWCPVCNVKVNDIPIYEEGTIVGDFQQERTAAMSEMFDNEGEDGIFPTTQLYRRLDNALKYALARRVEEYEQTIDVAMRDTGNRGVAMRAAKTRAWKS